jgi:uncharacterized protein (DUF1778 family)
MANSARKERLDMRIDSETKSLAERASAALGCSSVTEYITRLIRQDAPEILKQQASIKVTSDQFDAFMMACQDNTAAPSARILEAAKRLDQEGF